jgi:hypothetical protein
MDIGNMFDNAPAREEQTNGKSDDRKMDTVPDGQYTTEITDFSVFVSKKGDYYVSWWFEVLDGPHRGAQLQRFTGLGPKTFHFVKSTVKVVAGKVPQWTDLFVDGRTGPIQGKIVGKTVQVSQKSRQVGDRFFVNIYVDKVLQSEPVPEPPAEAFDEAEVDDLF